MNNSELLNSHFSAGSQISFRQLANGLVMAEVDTPLTTATVSLYGGHIVSWRPKQHVEPVLWLSKLAQFRQGKAIRGGVPICWPWFGAHLSQSSLPSHGYARISNWELTCLQTLTNGAIELTLLLVKSDSSEVSWNTDVQLTLKLTIGEILQIDLTTLNQSDQSVTFTEGLHTYF